MKAKTIKAILRKKFDDFATSIEDEAVRELVKANSIITGGSIASMLLETEVNDFDLYFTDKATTVAVAGYYVERFMKERTIESAVAPVTISVRIGEDDNRVRIMVKSAGVAGEEQSDSYTYFEGDPDPDAMSATEYIETAMKAVKPSGKGSKYHPVFLSSNAITLSDDVQVIIRFYGSPDEIHKNFDFAHCTSYWTSSNDQLVLRPEAMEALLTKELRYIGSRYPICSMIRTRKFLQRGFTINAGQLLKMAMQIHELDLTDVQVLQDQLVGVDAAYFNQMIDELKKRGGEKVNSTYLLELIDKLF